MQRQVHLPLYGDLSYDHKDLSWQLFQTDAMARLRDLSLSSIPHQFTPFGMPASRFSHSVGVGHLAKLLTEWHPDLAEHASTLRAAALLHDTGSPPFSHVAEPFLYALLGKTHEEQVATVLSGEVGDVLLSHEVDPARVFDVVTGVDPILGPLMAGSIDLDNFDNSLHLMLSYGYQDLPYHPVSLLEAWVIDLPNISLDSSYINELLGWQTARRQLYDLLRSDVQLSSTSMLYKALESAYVEGALDESFFFLDESGAITALREITATSRKMVDRAWHWKQYQKAWRVKFAETDTLIDIAQDWAIRRKVCNRLAKLAGVDSSDITLYLGGDRGGKKIHVPLIGLRGKEAEHRLEPKDLGWLCAIYVNDDARDWNGVPWRAWWDEVTEKLPKAQRSNHTFF